MSSSPAPANRAAGVSPASLTPDLSSPSHSAPNGGAPGRTDSPAATSPAATTQPPPAGTQPPAAGGPASTSVPRPRRADPYAVAALVSGGLALVPFALATGLVALVRTRRGRRPGRAAAIGGLVLGATWTTAGVVVAVFLGSSPATATPPHPLRGTVFTLHPGQCANTARNGVNRADAVACSQPHEVEVYATFRVAGAHWPGVSALGARARAGCQARVGGYLNPGLLGTSLTESYVFPDRGTWDAGGRTVVCEIRGATGQLTGSVRGLGQSAG